MRRCPCAAVATTANPTRTTPTRAESLVTPALPVEGRTLIRERVAKSKSRADDPVMGSPARVAWWALLATGYVQLDVPTSQCARRLIAGHVEREAIVTSGLAVVDHVDLIGEAILAIHLSGTFDVARRRVHHIVGGHAGAFHLGTVGAVIDVRQMAPELPLFDPAGDTEVSLGGGRPARDPAAAGGAITAGAGWRG